MRFANFSHVPSALIGNSALLMLERRDVEVSCALAFRCESQVPQSDRTFARFVGAGGTRALCVFDVIFIVVGPFLGSHDDKSIEMHCTKIYPPDLFCDILVPTAHAFVADA